MQYPVTVVRIFLLAAICMTQRRISRTPSVNVTLLVRRRKTRVDAWASLSNPRTVGGHVCSLFAAWNGPQQSVKTPVNNASIRYIGHCACTTLGSPLSFGRSLLFLLTFPLFFVKMQLASHLFSVIFGVFFTDVARFSYHLQVGGQRLNAISIRMYNFIFILFLHSNSSTRIAIVFATSVDWWFFFFFFHLYYKFLRFRCPVFE